MKRNLIAIFLVICLLLNLAACTVRTPDEKLPEDDTPAPDASEEEQAGDESVQEQWPLTLTDQCGTTVTLDSPAQSIVSCYYVSSYAVMALGLSDRMVGIENKANTRPIYGMSAPQFLELPAVGTMKESNVELIASLSPDLVIMPKKLSEAAATLRGLGLTVIVVNPETHEGLCQMLSLIGAACGASDRAQALISYYESERDTLATLTSGADKPTVYMCGNSTYLNTAPDAMYQGSLISLAGGSNAAASLQGDYWTEISYETLLSYDPDVIVIPCGADYTAQDIKNDAQLASLRAVQNDAIYTMPSSIEEWDSPIPSGILGAMWLTSVLHPSLYSAEQFLVDATNFYETFYGFAPDAALLK